MADEFEEKLSALDTSAVVMFSVETQPINKELMQAVKKYKKIKRSFKRSRHRNSFSVRFE
jgi:hypothetical protein